MPGAGASSITFWLRRCSEQSRSNRCTTLPWLSPNTCTSMWRGRAITFSSRTRASPNAASRLALRALQRGGEVRLALDQAHAAPAAAGHRLDHHGVADALGLAGERLGVLAVAVVARHHRHAGCGGDRLGLGLAAHAAHGVGRGADELDAGLADGLGEIGVLGKEAVARMDAVGARLLGGGDDPVDAQVALASPGPGRSPPPRRPAGRTARCGRRSETTATVSHPEPARGADDADGDLAAIGDQDLLEHARLFSLSLCFFSIGRGSLSHRGADLGNRAVHPRTRSARPRAPTPAVRRSARGRRPPGPPCALPSIRSGTAACPPADWS